MRIRVLFFGVLKDLVGRPADSIELRDHASAREVLDYYQSQFPQLKNAAASLAIAVNQQYADPSTTLKSNDEVALLPPVSGGSELQPTATTTSHCAIQRSPIETQTILNRLKQGSDGAAVVFEGVVRNQTRGRKTLYLDYEAYESMAMQQMDELAAKALADFKIRDVAIVHRLGRLEIGEISVLIVVVSAHRAAAFDACRWLIDTLKRTVPIWKKEYFEDGAVWADGDPFPPEIPRATPAP